jgi:hypothetical protein
MVILPVFVTPQLQSDAFRDGSIATSKNYSNLDAVNINSVVVKYDQSMDDMFTYEVRGYFIDTTGPFAQSEASVVSVEYLNFTASDSEFTTNGSEYYGGVFNATIYDGVTPPNLMIVPIDNPIVTDFRQVFVVKFELPVAIYNASGNPTVDIHIKITAFNNVTDNKTLMDDSYTASYYLKTNLLINSGHFNKDNIIAKINGVQVDPYSMYVTSPIFDIKLYDLGGNIIYHDPSAMWRSNLIVNFTSMKITNDYFSDVLTNVAPVGVVDELFYQTVMLNYSRRGDRLLQDGSFNRIERGSIYASERNSGPADVAFPTDANIAITQQTNVFDENMTMPYSTNIDASNVPYSFFVAAITHGDGGLAMLWIYTPSNSTDQMVIISMFSIGHIATFGQFVFSLGIINSSLYNVGPLFAENSYQNCTKIAALKPRSWYNIAIRMDSSNVSSQVADVFLDYSFVYHIGNISGYGYTPTDFLFGALNVTQMNITGWSLSSPKSPGKVVRTSFNVANIFVRDLSQPSTWRTQGNSMISYINDTYIEWSSVPVVSGSYHATGLRYNGVTYHDYFTWLGNTLPLYNVTTFTDSLFDFGGYKMLTPAETLQSLYGHDRVLNLSNSNEVQFRYGVTDQTKVVWNVAGHEAVGVSENSTTEVWITGATSNSVSSPSMTFTDSVATSVQEIVGIFNRTTSSMLLYVRHLSSSSYDYILNVTMIFTVWHHLRFDIQRHGSTGNATLLFYLDGMLTGSTTTLIDCRFDFFSISAGVSSSICVDAFGYRRSSWSSSAIFNDIYVVGDNLKQMIPSYSAGDYTFSDAPVGSDPTTIYPAFKRQSSGLTGTIIVADKYHGNVYDIVNGPRWTSFFTIDSPVVDANFVKLPEGYGYEARGRVAFWFYVNSSYNSSKFAFTIYDNGGTSYTVDDDSMHAFAIGNVFDDTPEQSTIVYFTKNTTNEIIKESSYRIRNDTWVYLVFEWNSTGNRLDVDGTTIFNGYKIVPTDVSVTIEPSIGNMSFRSGLYNTIGSGSAMAWFGSGFFAGGTSDWINDSSVRTVFTMDSYPTIHYISPSSKVGATWYSSNGSMDSLTFEYNTVVQHSYSPAILSVPQTDSNYTMQSMLTMNYASTVWKNLSLYYGGFYNLTFRISSSNGSLPVQVAMDSATYVVFTSSTTMNVSILNPINPTATNLRVSFWSSDGNYTIGNIRITLTAKTPQFVDAFKIYVNQTSVFSKYIISHGFSMTNITTGSYYLLATTYLAEVAYFNKITISSSATDFYITEPSFRQIVIEYTDQRAVHIDYNNFQTFEQVGDAYQLIPTNVLLAKVGTTITLLSKNIFNEVVFFGSFVVTSTINYINIIVTLHSLKVYNQREDFVHGIITKDFAPQFFWSEWIAPGEIINYRLTTGSYTISITDTLDNTATYKYRLFGDDVLIVRSQYTLEQITNDILNVNQTIGNQITNVAINITNQNSAINNSVVNVDISISNLNTTLGTQLVTMDANIISVNSTINEQTIYLTNILANLNSTIMTQTVGIESFIANVNSTINDQTVLMITYFTNINSTILAQSANMQQYLININNTINSIDVNLTQAFFTDLMNNQTGALTGYISSTVNNQTTELTIQINNVSAYINNQLINVNNNIYNQTVVINGSFNFGFTQIMSTNVQIENLIRKTQYSNLINWSDSVEVAGITELTMMNSYSFPIIAELRRGSKQENFTIYSDNFIKVYVPSGLYKYRLINLLNGSAVPRTSNETAAEAAIFKDFFVSNTSNYIETSFAKIAVPIIPVQTGISTTDVVVAIVFIGAIGAIVGIIWYSRSRANTDEKPVTMSKTPSKQSGTSKSSPRSSPSGKTVSKNRPTTRKGLLPSRRQ